MSDERNQTGVTGQHPGRPAIGSFAFLAVLAVAALMVWQYLMPVRSAVAWQQDLPAAMASADSAGKPLLLNFTGKGCIYCRQMEAEVFPQPEVLAELDKFVPVKIDAHDNERLSVKYNVGGLPAFVVADAEGNPLAMTSGFMPADRFVQFLRTAGDSMRTIAAGR